jgi:diaminopimelate epimerase
MRGRRFYKMSGSGNDFVVFDAREGSVQNLLEPSLIRRLCDRRQGIGADGVVIFEPCAGADVLMTYFNSDGSRGEFCGNAALCITRLVCQLGLAEPAGMTIQTDDGIVRSRLVRDRPEVELRPVTRIDEAVEAPSEAGERRMGYTVAGVPHVVVLCEDVERVDVTVRGAAIRRAEWTMPLGANVNFVSRRGETWAIRTFERGVEGETLACGSGAVAAAILLHAWRLAGLETVLKTRSGGLLEVTIRDQGGEVLPRLRGAGTLVFEGRVVEG